MIHTPHPIKKLLQQRILILDGAMGTMVQRHKLTEADYRGERFKDWHKDLKGNNDLLVITKPEVIKGIHCEYLAAGADIIETDTFGANATTLKAYGMESLNYELNFAGAKLAREACNEFATPDKPRFVAGVLGPTDKTATISPDVNDPAARNITFDQLVADYAEATRGLMDGGADLLLIETIFDTLNAKAAIFAVQQVFEQRGETRPIMISGTITDASGRTLTGQVTEAFYNSLAHAKPISIGLNCALGAEELRQYVAEMSRVATCYVSAHPNAGLPNPLAPTGYDDTPATSTNGPPAASSTSSAVVAAPRPPSSRPSPRRCRASRRARFRRIRSSAACPGWSRSTSATSRCSSTSASAATWRVRPSSSA